MTLGLSATRFGARFLQHKPFAEEASSFAKRGFVANANNSEVPLSSVCSGSPLETLLKQPESPSGKPLFDATTLLKWAQNDHFKALREGSAGVTIMLNPLIALAAGIVGHDFGKEGYKRLDLKPLLGEFPRVVEVISTRIPDEIKRLKTMSSKDAGLDPVIDFLAANTDKYYVADNQAVLYTPPKPADPKP